MPELIDRLADDLAAVRWPDAAEIRGRAARRRRRRTVIAGAALALCLTVAGLAAGRPARSPVAAPSPSAAPEIIVIPDAALLRPEDIGPDVVVTTYDASAFDVVRHGFGFDTCLESRGLTVGAPSRYTLAQSVLRRPASGAEPDNDDFVLNQDLYRLPVADAPAFMGELRAAVAACEDWTPGVTPYEWEGQRIDVIGYWRWPVIESGGIGDDSLMVRPEDRATRADTGAVLNKASGQPMLYIRVGDLISVIRADADLPTPELLRIGEAAVARMCVAANPPSC